MIKNPPNLKMMSKLSMSLMTLKTRSRSNYAILSEGLVLMHHGYKYIVSTSNGY